MENKKSKKKRIVLGWVIVVIVAVILILVLANRYWENQRTQEESSEPIHLELVYAYQNAQWNSAIEKMVEEFNSIHPDIEVEYQIHYENKVYENILNTLIARDELGDIVQMKTPEAYVNSGILGEISPELVLNTGLESTYAIGGKIYGVGAVNATSGIIYNKELFEKYSIAVPETYQEFLAVCDKLNRLGVIPVGVGGSDLWHMEYWVNHFFRSDVLYTNPDWLEQCTEGNVSWMDSEITTMLTHLKQLFSNGRVDANWLSTPDGSLAYMMSEGEVAMIYSGAWVSQEILRLNPDMELGWFYVPDEEGNIQVDEMQDTFWSVTKECQEDQEKYQAALTFLEFFYAASNYSNVMDSITAFPTVANAFNYNMDPIQAQIQAAFEENQDHITGFIGDENCPQGFESQMLAAVCQMLEGKKEIGEIQEEIQTMWETSLREEVENQ